MERWRIYFSGVWCIYILGLFTVADALLITDVSANWCICAGLIFAVADTLFGNNVSATCFSLNLQILFSLPVMYNCIYILPFLWFEDASFANFSSASHVFDNLKMLLIEILHPQFVLSITCRYSPVKLCIFNLRKSTIADIVAQYPLRSIYFMDWADTWLTKKLI